jgi:hypothetical protein
MHWRNQENCGPLGSDSLKGSRNSWTFGSKCIEKQSDYVEELDTPSSVRTYRHT